MLETLYSCQDAWFFLGKTVFSLKGVQLQKLVSYNKTTPTFQIQAPPRDRWF